MNAIIDKLKERYTTKCIRPPQTTTTKLNLTSLSDGYCLKKISSVAE